MYVQTEFDCTDTNVQNNNKFIQSKVTSQQIKNVMHGHTYIYIYM